VEGIGARDADRDGGSGDKGGQRKAERCEQLD
jgi:hypothetical protein